MSAQRKPPAREAPEKLLPQNVEAEAAVLGSILIGGDEPGQTVMARVFALIEDPQAFSREAHRTIFAAMVSLYEADTPVDLITVTDELSRRGQLDDVDGTAYVASLANNVPTAESAEYYARIVQRTWVNRGLVSFGAKASAVGYDDPDAPVALAAIRNQWQWLEQQYAHVERKQDSPLRPLSLAELRERPKPEPLISGWFMAGLTSIVYGDGGSGKSTLLVDMACHVAMGWDWTGHHVKPGTVVYLAAEGGSGIVGRVDAWRAVHNVTADLERLYVIPCPARLYEPAVRDELVTQLTAFDDLVWLIVDTVSMTSAGLDENSNSDMASWWEAMARVREATGAHVTGVHHSPHAGGGRPRGASALYDNVDTAIEVLRAPDTDMSSVTCKKQRDGWKRFPPFSFTAEQEAVDGYDGLTFGVLKQASVTSQASATGSGNTLLDKLEDADWRALEVLHAARTGLGWREWQRESKTKLQRRLPNYWVLGFIQKTPNGNFQSTLACARALHDHEASKCYQPLPGNTSVTPGSTVTAVTRLYRAGNTVTPTGSASEATSDAVHTGDVCRYPSHERYWSERLPEHGGGWYCTACHSTGKAG